MSIIATIAYIALFLASIINTRIMAFAIPIFTFVYPSQLSTLSFGDANLSRIFIIIAFFKSFSFSSELVSKQWQKAIAVFYIGINAYTQIISIPFIPATDYYNCVKALIDVALCGLATIVMIRFFTNKKYNRHLLVGLFVAIAFESIIAIGLIFYNETFSIYYCGKEFEDISSYYRATGSFNGPWALGGFLSMSIILLINYFSKASGLIEKWLIIINMLLCIYALALTQSRASWLFLAVSIVFLLIRRDRHFLKISLWLVIAAIIAINFWADWSNFAEIVQHRFEYTYDNAETHGLDNSSAERLMIWDKILSNYDFSFFITGYGIRNAYQIFGSSGHNAYLSILVNNGLIGIIILFCFFRKMSKILSVLNSNNRNYIYALLLGIASYSLTADLIYTSSLLTMGLLILSIFMFDTYQNTPTK